MTGLALAPTLITLFSLIEASVPRSRLNEAMGFVQTGMSGGIAPGAWLAGLVADGSGGSAAYWVCTSPPPSPRLPPSSSAAREH